MKRNEQTGAPLRPDAYLRLQASGANEPRIEIPLFVREGEALFAPMLDVCSGSVRQSQKYRIDVFARDGEAVDFSFAALTVNGKELRYIRRGSGIRALMGGSEAMRGFELDPDQSLSRLADCEHPFSLICGYARMSVALFDESHNCLVRYAAKDIVCCQDDPVDVENVNAMMSVLASSPEENSVIGWMSGDALQAKGGAYSILQGGLARNSARSIPTYLSIVDAGLSAMEDAFSYVKDHAAARVQKEDAVVEADQVRRIGASEMRWLASHLDALSPASSRASISFRGRGYVPARMLSPRAVRSFDVYENRLCLAYLDAVAKALADFDAKISDNRYQVKSLHANDAAGRRVAEYSFAGAAALSLQDACRSYAAVVGRLRSRAIRLLALYRRVLPGVRVVPLSSLRVMRTKIFKEIRAYSRMYVHIERFFSYGEEVPGEEGLAIASLRLDRAYETYALYRMLDCLRTAGFELDAAWLCEYDASSNPYFEIAHVNNAYRLVRGNTVVELFYEPVVSYDGSATPAGPSLRRMRKGRSYTPDFVLTVTRFGEEGHCEKKTIVLDAKYRPRRNVVMRFKEGERTQYERCVDKYLFNMVDAETLRIPDALWLLCGLEDDGPQAVGVPAAPWVEESGAMPSGVALLTPRLGMEPILRAIGLIALHDAMPKSDVLPGIESFLPGDAVCDAIEHDEEQTGASASESSQVGASAGRVAGSLVFDDDAPCGKSDASSERGADALLAVSEVLVDDSHGGLAASADLDDSSDNAAKKTVSARYNAAKAERARELEAKKAKKARKREEKRARRKQARDEAQAAKAEPAVQSPAKTFAANSASASLADGVRGLDEIVLEIIEETRPEDFDLLFDSRYCHRELALGASLLNRRAVRNYEPLPGYAGVFYLCTKLPTYRRAVEKYLEKLKK